MVSYPLDGMARVLSDFYALSPPTSLVFEATSQGIRVTIFAGDGSSISGLVTRAQSDSLFSLFGAALNMVADIRDDKPSATTAEDAPE